MLYCTHGNARTDFNYICHASLSKAPYPVPAALLGAAVATVCVAGAAVTTSLFQAERSGLAESPMCSRKVAPPHCICGCQIYFTAFFKYLQWLLTINKNLGKHRALPSPLAATPRGSTLREGKGVSALVLLAPLTALAELLLL